MTLTVGTSGASSTWLGDIQNTAGTINLTVVAPGGELQIGLAGGVGTFAYNGNTTVGVSSDLRFDASNVLPHGAGKGNWVINGRILSNGRTLTCNGLSGTGTLGAGAELERGARGRPAHRPGDGVGAERRHGPG